MSFMCDDNNERKQSEDVVVETVLNENESLKKHLVESAVKVINKKSPEIYEIQMDETFVDPRNQVRKMELGKPSQSKGLPEKVIMIVGETGCGKTTHINSMVNYICGVKHEDPFRFRILTDSKEKSLQQNKAKSQPTQWVTGYTFHYQAGVQLNCTLTLIDTPGFGDTGGIANDKKIVERIKAFFTMEKGVDHIDAVGFVVKSSSIERYVFDSILSLFGKNIGDNIVIFITFADAQPPPVIATLKKAGLNYKSVTKFNNSAVFASTEGGDENTMFGQMFWKMGMNSFEKFFIELMRLQPKSLTLTRDVLHQREALQVLVMGIRQKVDLGLSKLNQLENQINEIRMHKSDIERSKNFSYTLVEEKVITERLPTGQYALNCIACNRTCHGPYVTERFVDEKHCAAMDSNGRCTVCDKKCHWNEHRNFPFRYKIVSKSVTKTCEELLNLYRSAQQKEQSAQRVAQSIYEDYIRTRVEVFKSIKDCNECLKRAEEIALKPDPSSVVDYIDKMIEMEERNKKDGFRERKQQLQDIRVMANCLKEMRSGDILKSLADNEDRISQKYKNFVDPRKTWDGIHSAFSSFSSSSKK